MKRIIGIGLLCAWVGTENIPAQETIPSNISASNETPAALSAPAEVTAEADSVSAASAVSTNEAPPPAVTVPEELRAHILARFPFDVNASADPAAGLAIPVTFKRDSAATAEGQSFESNAPRLVNGKFGKGMLLEDACVNLLTPTQADVEGDTTGEFIPLKDTTIALTTNVHWQGRQALKVTTSGTNGEEGVAIETMVDKALYNGNAIVPAHYVASVYLRGSGNLMLSLKEAGVAMPTEPVYVDLHPKEWKRFSCTHVCSFPAKTIGPKHEKDWKQFLTASLTNTAEQAGSPLEVKLQFNCVTIDKQKTEFVADGFQLEPRWLPFAGQGAGLSPHAWTPGKTTVAQEEFSFSIKDDALTSWKKSGSLSFWFKPHWAARDGTQELLLDMRPDALHLRHANARIKFYPAGMEFKPYDWKDNWHHIAVTWNKEGTRVLYVDGYDYLNSQGEQLPIPLATDLLAFSCSGNGNAPNGIVDELILFTEVLNTDQVKDIAAYDPLNPPKPNPPESTEESPATPDAPATTPAETEKPTDAIPEASTNETSSALEPKPADASPAGASTTTEAKQI